MSLHLRRRDLTTRGIAGCSLDERVVDLLSDIMLASEKIESMIVGERGEPPFPEFCTALDTIYSEAASLIGKVLESGYERKTQTH